MTWLPHGRRAWAYVLASAVTAAALVALSGVRSWPDQWRGMRPGNRSEELYRYVAQQLEAPALCQKISSSAMVPGGFFIAPSYTRSDCYDFIAGRTRRPALCWHVQRLGAFQPLNQQTSIWSCLDHATHGWNAGIAVSPRDLVEFFEAIGYDPDSLGQDGVISPIVKIADEYRALSSRPNLVARITRVLDSHGQSLAPTHDDTVDAAYLADLAALETGAGAWCDRIPPDIPAGSERASFHDWCLFTVASNRNDSALCTRLAIRRTKMDALSLRSQCERLVQSPYPRNTRYGPEVPDDARARRLIRMLRYELPRARDLPVGRLGVAYEGYLDALNDESDAAHRSARRRLLDRIAQLPTFDAKGNPITPR
jgi:hypothetical protein